MARTKGRLVPITPARRLIGDVVHFGKKLPSVTVQRTMQLEPLSDIRDKPSVRVGWCTLFLKAFACAAVEYPELRRAYLSWPRVRIYEHPFSRASVAIEREHREEKIVLFAQIRSPESLSLEEISELLRWYKFTPVEEVPLFLRAVKFGRLPQILRRIALSGILNMSGSARAKRMGTFGVSAYSSLGASSLNPISPLTCLLNYDVVQPNGSVVVRLVYDHRVMDGSVVARALASMEKILCTDFVTELETVASRANPPTPRVA